MILIVTHHHDFGLPGMDAMDRVRAGARLFCGYGRRSHLVVAWRGWIPKGGREDGGGAGELDTRRYG